MFQKIQLIFIQSPLSICLHNEAKVASIRIFSPETPFKIFKTLDLVSAPISPHLIASDNTDSNPHNHLNIILRRVGSICPIPRAADCHSSLGQGLMSFPMKVGEYIE